MKSNSDFIDALGGTAEFARKINATMPEVSRWRKSGLPITRERLQQYKRMAQEAGLDFSYEDVVDVL